MIFFLLLILNISLTIYLISKIKKIMGTIEQFQAQLSRIDAATSGIADELRRLKDQITNAGMPPEIELQVLNDLTAAADRLEGIGKSEAPDVGIGEGEPTAEEQPIV
jgi:hypothetical protein